MLRYGLDILTPQSRGGEPWQPVMKNQHVRQKYTLDELIQTIDRLKASNAAVQVRAVELVDDDPTYSV